jgi:squalene-associated FAD-dependent desaturase
MTKPTVYVIGAGLAGLSAAVALARRGRHVEVIEAANQAGGRCRSYFDTTLGRIIDNGNHLVLSGNRATFDYLRAIGAEKGMAGPDYAEFAFADIPSGARWRITPNDGPIPWWIFSSARRVPRTTASDYIGLGGLALPNRGKQVCEVIACRGVLWERLMRPFLLAALNTDPETASAALAGAVIRETLAKGGRYYYPRVATPYLAAVFVEPALACLKKRGAVVRLGQRLRRLEIDEGRITALTVGEVHTPLGPKDRVVLATPPWVTAELLPGITVPDRHSAIVNAHFLYTPPPGTPPIMGVVGGTVEWIFAFEDRFSITISGADRLVDQDRESLAQTLWHDVSAVYGLKATLPPWQIVKEKRATFAASVEQAAKRPAATTVWRNLLLAGDWTDTGLPATIEGAVRSGHRAAELVLRQSTL